VAKIQFYGKKKQDTIVNGATIRAGEGKRKILFEVYVTQNGGGPIFMQLMNHS